MRPFRWMFALCWMGLGAATLAAGVGGWNALNRPVQLHLNGGALLKVDLPWTPLDDVESVSDRGLRLNLLRQTHMALICSPNVLSAAAARLQEKNPTLLAGKTDPVRWLGDALRVEDVASTALLTVSMPGVSRDQQAVIVNIVVEEYLSNSVMWSSGAFKSRIELAENSLASYRQHLTIKRRTLREDTADPERQAALRDEIAVLEEVAHRTALVLERLRLDQSATDSVHLISHAHP